EELDRPEYVVPLLYGQWGLHVMRSEHRLALPRAEQMVRIGGGRHDVSTQLLGRLMHGKTRLWLGEFVAARTLFDQCHGLGDPTHRAVHASFSTEDQYASMLAHLAQTLGCLGYVDQSRSRFNDALTEARRLEHAF